MFRFIRLRPNRRQLRPQKAYAIHAAQVPKATFPENTPFQDRRRRRRVRRVA